jgi:Tol biopolymer transport system component
MIETPSRRASSVWNRRLVLGGALATGSTAWLGACLPGSNSGGTSSGTAGSGPLTLVFGAEGNVTAMRADGTGRKQLTNVPQGGLARDPAWSPDGKQIAYAYTPPLPSVRGPGGMLPLPVTGIYVMKDDGSGAQVQIAHDTPGIGNETPIWAPDGKSFFVTYTELVVESNIVRDQIVEVARVTPGGGQRQRLVPNGAFPTISKDGKQLVCVVTGRDGQSLMLCAADGSNQKTLVPSGTLDGLASPRFSPDGKQVVFSAVGPQLPIPTVTPVRRSGASLGALFAPRTASAHGLPMDLFLVSVDGGAPKRLTQLAEDNPAAAWSPDGKQLAILSGGGVYKAQLGNEQVTNVDPKGGHGSIDWRAG